MLDNAKFRNRSVLPELRVVKEGFLRGYVIINPRWGAFTTTDYMRASASAYEGEEIPGIPTVVQVETHEGEYDLRGFEIAHMDFMDMSKLPSVSIGERAMKFSTTCYRKLPGQEWVELLIHPTMKRLAIRPTSKDNRNAIQWGVKSGNQTLSRTVHCTAFYQLLCKLLEFDPSKRYRLGANTTRDGNDCVLVFYAMDAIAYVQKERIPRQENDQQALMTTGKQVGVLPEQLTYAFGREYFYELSLSALNHLTRDEWKLRIEGQLCSTGTSLHVTDFEELRIFIAQELRDTSIWEDRHDES